MRCLLSLIFCALLMKLISGDTCPAVYKRFSVQHSLCLSPKCKPLQRGLQDESEKTIILEEHNKLRSKMATGQVKGFPAAANMMQLVWDDELQAVAQKWAEQCIFEHDCNDCRKVESFAVGQNLAMLDLSCPDNFCIMIDKANWTEMIQTFYDEISEFPASPQAISHYEFQMNYGHFSQVVWANTWRIGCGYVRFETNTDEWRQIYVFNYGPAGNGLDEPIYQQGQQCSKCPQNSCCGSSCGSSNKPNYPGLCKMYNVNEAPIYASDLKPNLFDCDFSDNNDDCRFSVVGTDNWKMKNTPGGKYLATELKGGETSSISFDKVVTPKVGDFCIRVDFRKGPTVADKKPSSILNVQFKPETQEAFNMRLDLDYSQFFNYNLNITIKDSFQFSVDAKVPSGGSAQYVEIQRILMYDGKCKSQ